MSTVAHLPSSSVYVNMLKEECFQKLLKLVSRGVTQMLNVTLVFKEMREIVAKWKVQNYFKIVHKFGKLVISHICVLNHVCALL